MTMLRWLAAFVKVNSGSINISLSITKAPLCLEMNRRFCGRWLFVWQNGCTAYSTTSGWRPTRPPGPLRLVRPKMSMPILGVRADLRDLRLEVVITCIQPAADIVLMMMKMSAWSYAAPQYNDNTVKSGVRVRMRKQALSCCLSLSLSFAVCTWGGASQHNQ